MTCLTMADFFFFFGGEVLNLTARRPTPTDLFEPIALGRSRLSRYSITAILCVHLGKLLVVFDGPNGKTIS